MSKTFSIKTFSIKTLSTKTLLASSAIAFGLLAALGSAQADGVQSKPTVGTSRQIEVLPGNSAAQQPETELRGDNRADAPPDANVADASAVQQDAPPADEPGTTQSAPSTADAKIMTADEAKRLNRQRYIERYEARRYAEPQYVEPRYNERYAQPRYEERYVEQRYVQPRQYAQRDAYAQRYQAAPSYGYVQRRTAEHCAPRGY